MNDLTPLTEKFYVYLVGNHYSLLYTVSNVLSFWYMEPTRIFPSSICFFAWSATLLLFVPL